MTGPAIFRSPWAELHLHPYQDDQHGAAMRDLLDLAAATLTIAHTPQCRDEAARVRVGYQVNLLVRDHMDALAAHVVEFLDHEAGSE